ncbi:MAG: CHAT domain-containing protein [Thermodesulfobacteriota bacterium]
MGIKSGRIFLILNCLILLGIWVLAPSLCVGQQWGKRQQEERAFRGSHGADSKRELEKGKDLYWKARTPQDLEDTSKKFDESKRSYEASGDMKSAASAASYKAHSKFFLGEYDEALSLCKEALELARKSNNVRVEVWVTSLMSKIYARMGKTKESEAALGEALETAKRARFTEGISRAVKGMGDMEASKGNYEEALQKYEKAAVLARKANDNHQLGLASMGMGRAYQALGQHDVAVEHLRVAASALKKFGDVRWEATSHQELAKTYQALGRNNQAIEHLQKSRELNVNIKNFKLGAGNSSDLGFLYQDRGQYQKSLEAFKESLAIAKKSGDKKLEALMLCNLGKAYTILGNYASALDCLQQSVETARQTREKKQQSQSLVSLGHLFFKWGKHDKAGEFFEQGLTIAEKAGDKKSAAEALAQVALLNYSIGRYEEALATLARAKKAGERSNLAGGTIDDLMGNLYIEMGKLPEAEKLIEKSGTDISRGRLRLAKQDYTDAKIHYEKLRESAEKTGNVDNRFVAYTGLGLALEGLSEFAPAADAYRKAIETVEELRANLSLHERMEFHNVRLGGFLRTGPYEGIARVLMRMNKPGDSLKESEYAKARMFSEAISRRVEGRTQDIPEGVLERDLELNERLTALLKQRRSAYEREETKAIETLEPQIIQAKEELAAHVDWLRSKYPLFAATKYPSPMDLTRTAISRAEWVVAYDVTDQGLLIYLTKGKDVIKGVFKPISRTLIENDLRHFLKALDMTSGEDDLTEKLKSFDFDAGRRLAALLIEEVLTALPERTPLIVIPDDCLGVLPLEMLVLSDGGDLDTSGDVPQTKGVRFFGDRNPLIYYQSVTALTLARTVQEKKEDQARLLVVADPVFAADDPRSRRWTVQLAGAEMAQSSSRIMAAMKKEGLGDIEVPRLPLTGDLANGLSQLYQDKCDVYVGLDASKDTLLTKIAPSLPQYGFIVFATHGFVDSSARGMAEPLLVLSLVPPGTDGLLKASEVMGLKMSASVVTLVACQTGLGPHVSGEGTMGMGRAFQYAGARSVLMSMWSVAESSSIQLVQAFFRYVAAGKGKPEALRLARQEVRNSGYDHPFFWAPFILTGEAN